MPGKKKKVKVYILVIEINLPFPPFSSQNASHLALSVQANN